MKRLLAALFLALVCALVVASGVASADPKQDLVSGTGQFVSFAGSDSQLHVNAQSGPSGEDPRGHFFFTRSNFGTNVFDFSGRVTCVNVSGNLAAVGGVVTKSETPSAPEGSGILINIEDRGPHAGDPASVFQRSVPPTNCEFIGFTVDSQKGNFEVHDATP
jgi:hypothetical protein